jgi:hypothetical protein
MAALATQHVVLAAASRRGGAVTTRSKATRGTVRHTRGPQVVRPHTKPKSTPPPPSSPAASSTGLSDKMTAGKIKFGKFRNIVVAFLRRRKDALCREYRREGGAGAKTHKKENQLKQPCLRTNGRAKKHRTQGLTTTLSPPTSLFSSAVAVRIFILRTIPRFLVPPAQKNEAGCQRGVRGG